MANTKNSNIGIGFIDAALRLFQVAYYFSTIDTPIHHYRLALDL